MEIKEVGRKLSELIKEFNLEDKMCYDFDGILIVTKLKEIKYGYCYQKQTYYHLNHNKTILNKDYFMLESKDGDKLYGYSNGEYKIIENTPNDIEDMFI